MILVDTGFFIAMFDRGDDLNRRAVLYAQALREPLLVTEYVLLESINHFSRNLLRPRANDIAELILSDPAYEFVSASRSLLEQGLEIHKRSTDKDWSLTDCISFHVMRERGITRALAFDHHFEQAGFEAMLRRDPS